MGSWLSCPGHRHLAGVETIAEVVGAVVGRPLGLLVLLFFFFAAVNPLLPQGY